MWGRVLGGLQVAELQQQDMHDLGMLILSLACRSPATAGTKAESMNFLAQHYSHELHNLVGSLVTKPPSVFEVRALQRNMFFFFGSADMDF